MASRSRTIDLGWHTVFSGSTPGLDADDAEDQLDGQGEVEFALYPTVVMEGTTIHVAWAEYSTSDGQLSIRYQRGEVSYG